MSYSADDKRQTNEPAIADSGACSVDQNTRHDATQQQPEAFDHMQLHVGSTPSRSSMQCPERLQTGSLRHSYKHKRPRHRLHHPIRFQSPPIDTTSRLSLPFSSVTPHWTVFACDWFRFGANQSRLIDQIYISWSSRSIAGGSLSCCLSRAQLPPPTTTGEKRCRRNIYLSTSSTFPYTRPLICL